MIDRGPLADKHLEGNNGFDHYGQPLTARQLECLSLLALGFTIIEAADYLGIAAGTYKNHLINARARMGARTTLRAVVLYATKLHTDDRRRAARNRLGQYDRYHLPGDRHRNGLAIDQAGAGSSRSPVAMADSRAGTPPPPDIRRSA